MTGLVKYEAARAALQAAHDVDEVKDIRDKAQAMQAYANQAKDTQLVEWASEIKVRAERRAGEMLAVMKVNGHGHKNLKKGSKLSPESPEVTPGPTLDSIGISKKQSSQWQKVAAIPEKAFEKSISDTKDAQGVVTTAAVLRAAKPQKTKAVKEPKAPKPKKPEGVPAAEVAKLTEQIKALTEQKDDLADTARELEDKLTAFETTEPDEQQKEIMKLQKRIIRLEAEIQRLTVARNDCQNKNNQLIRQVKMLQKASR